MYSLSDNFHNYIGYGHVIKLLLLHNSKSLELYSKTEWQPVMPEVGTVVALEV